MSIWVTIFGIWAQQYEKQKLWICTLHINKNIYEAQTHFKDKRNSFIVQGLLYLTSRMETAEI